MIGFPGEPSLLASSTAASSFSARSRVRRLIAFSPITKIFRRERRFRRARRYATGAALESLTALKPGDYVVHLEHGVGSIAASRRYLCARAPSKSAVIEYEGGDRLNVPCIAWIRFERYRSAADITADSAPPRLHALGGKRWHRSAIRRAQRFQEMTVELLDLSPAAKSRRDRLTCRIRCGSVSSNPHFFSRHARSAHATTDVKSDMERPRPMDRLLVGDVGYGKDRDRRRAAFKAVQSGRQVVVLVPTDESSQTARANFRRASG